MKIVFYNPPFKGKYSRAQRSPAITKSGTLYYPIWLAYSAGWAEKCGHEIMLIDAPALNLDEEKSLKYIIDFNPGLIVIQTTTPTIGQDCLIAKKIKEFKLSSFILLVGTHVSAMPQETLSQYPIIDGLAIGEFEETVEELASILQKGADLKMITGLSFRQDDQIVNNPKRSFTNDLDKYPFITEVYKKHLDIKKYFFAASRYPMVQIFTSRGCPAHCFFCVYPQTFHGHKLRMRSAENVVSEMLFISREMPEVKEIVIEDDTFTINEERVRKICNMLINEKIKITWNANARVSLSLETMKLMKRAGCRLLIPGYESGNQEILNNMKKGITLDQSRNFAMNAKKAGLMVHGCFLVGGPGETKETMQQTLKFALELNPNTAQFFPIMIYPGTEAYQWAKTEGYLTTNLFSKWLNSCGEHSTVVSRPGLSSNDLVDFCNNARKKYYIRPSYIASRLWQGIHDKNERVRLWRGFRTFFKHLNSGHIAE